MSTLGDRAVRVAAPDGSSCVVLQWPDRCIDIDQLMRTAACGDVIVFQGRSAISFGIRVFTGSPYTHVGVVVRTRRPIPLPPFDARNRHTALPPGCPPEWNELYVLHAVDFTRLPDLRRPDSTYTVGVQCNRLYDMVMCYDGVVCYAALGGSVRYAEDAALNDDTSSYTRALLTRLQRRHHAAERAHTLYHFCMLIAGTSYEHSMLRLLLVSAPTLQSFLLRGSEPGDGDDTYFCSELAAVVVHMLGLAPMKLDGAVVHPEQYAPHHFASTAVLVSPPRQLFRVDCARQRFELITQHDMPKTALCDWHTRL
jgi:hypothetical protein